MDEKTNPEQPGREAPKPGGVPPDDDDPAKKPRNPPIDPPKGIVKVTVEFAFGEK